jgi:hypothetical protein
MVAAAILRPERACSSAGERPLHTEAQQGTHREDPAPGSQGVPAQRATDSPCFPALRYQRATNLLTRPATSPYVLPPDPVGGGQATPGNQAATREPPRGEKGRPALFCGRSRRSLARASLIDQSIGKGVPGRAWGRVLLSGLLAAPDASETFGAPGR